MHRSGKRRRWARALAIPVAGLLLAPWPEESGLLSSLQIEAQVRIGVGEHGKSWSSAPVEAINDGAIDHSIAHPHRH